jgi:hypothetical protein
MGLGRILFEPDSDVGRVAAAKCPRQSRDALSEAIGSNKLEQCRAVALLQVLHTGDRLKLSNLTAPSEKKSID